GREDVAVFLGQIREALVAQDLAGIAAQPVQRDDERRFLGLVVGRRHEQAILHLLVRVLEIVRAFLNPRRGGFGGFLGLVLREQAGGEKYRREKSDSEPNAIEHGALPEKPWDEIEEHPTG